MSQATLSGAEFKKQLRAGKPKMGLFLNAHSPTIAEQLAHSGYDWLLVDTQHGPMGYEKLSAMLSGISNGGAKSIVLVQRDGTETLATFKATEGTPRALDFSPDGKRIVLDRYDPDGKSSLWILTPATKKLAPLVESGFSPVWNGR